MRINARVDSNQREITLALRAAGATVENIAPLGKGRPDLLVGYHGNNYLLEVKSKGGKLTPAEEEWHIKWRGQKSIVFTTTEALRAIGAVH